MDADATISAASGPNRTAAKSIGSAEIDSSTVELNLTLPRSAKAAVAASPKTTTSGPIAAPESVSPTKTAVAVAASTAAYTHTPIGDGSNRAALGSAAFSVSDFSCTVPQKGYKLVEPLVLEQE